MHLKKPLQEALKATCKGHLYVKAKKYPHTRIKSPRKANKRLLTVNYVKFTLANRYTVCVYVHT